MQRLKILYEYNIEHGQTPAEAIDEMMEYGDGLMDIFDALGIKWTQKDIAEYVAIGNLAEIIERLT